MPNFEVRLSTRTGETKTAQIFNQIAGAIETGRLASGEALTSERALAARLGVSRNIVRNAYRRLEERGLVETVSTAGRRVARKRRRRTRG